jgi:hypothetical protein
MTDDRATDGRERRRWRRLRSELRLQLHIMDQDSGRKVPAIGTHLNPLGIFVQLADPPPLGTIVEITLNAEGTDGVLTAKGEVVDRVVLDQESARPPGVGVKLSETGPGWSKLYTWLLNEVESDETDG